MNGTSKRFYGTWPEGRRTVTIEKPLFQPAPLKKRVEKPLSPLTVESEIEAERDFENEGGASVPN